METEILEPLLSRCSDKRVVPPAPTAEQLEQILACAAAAPDHKGLQPYRFLYFYRPTGVKLAAELAQLAPEGLNERQQKRIGKVQGQFDKPLVIVVVAKIDDSKDCPAYEQYLSVGAAAMNILNACHFLGYAAFWSSTLDPIDSLLPQLLPLNSGEHLCGLIAVGTAQEPTQKTRAHPSQYSREIRK